MKAAFLPDRGVVKVAGEDARNFLNGLVTTDVTQLAPSLGRFGALLTPQGKITVDFLITEAPEGHGGGFLLDCPRPLAPALAAKLGFYKLRAKVTVENLSENLGVIAAWGGEPAMKPDLAFADPRDAALGWRILAPQELTQKVADLTQNQVAAGRDQVVGAMGAAGQTLSQSASDAQDKFSALEGDVESRIKKNPWGAVAVAGLIGLLIGKMS